LESIDLKTGDYELIYSLVVKVWEPDYSPSYYTYTVNGAFCECTADNNGLDLFMAPVIKKVWVNFYPNREAFYHDTLEEADLGAGGNRIGKAVEITIEH
jgi:hypothetical protein